MLINLAYKLNLFPILQAKNRDLMKQVASLSKGKNRGSTASPSLLSWRMEHSSQAISFVGL